MPNLVIVGTGYVGLVTGVCLAEIGHTVTCLDINKSKIEMMTRGVSPIYEEGLEELMKKNYNAGRITYTTDYKNAYKNADAIIIGVGTPELDDGSPNLTYLYEVIDQIIESIVHNSLIIIKSTVPIGTGDKIENYIKDKINSNILINVASNPEFLSQGTAVKDTLYASRIVFGTNSAAARELLYKIYEPFNIPIVSTTRMSAEMIKYASNDFLALKISFMNDIANLCEIVGADIEDVAKGMGYDDRIGNKFLQAGVGYGGSCFPKDTKALHWLAKINGYKLKTIKAAIEVNESQKLVLLNKARKYYNNFKNIKVAVLGLTFKPNTDDIREAPSIKNINVLLEEGAIIKAYDPIGIESCKKIYGEKVDFKDDIADALEDADICFIFTQWKQIKAIKPEVFKLKMRKALVFDGRNCYKIEDMIRANIDYHSIGR